MIKQEEIREGLAKIIWLDNHPDTDVIWEMAEQTIKDHWLRITDKYLSHLHSQGVVIKVDGELPENPFEHALDTALSFELNSNIVDKMRAYGDAQADVLEAGYTATEPLIEGKK